jgi:hypothetical protein
MKKIEIIVAVTIFAALSAFAGIGTVSVGLVETSVVPARADRKWITLQNNSTNDIFVKFDSSTNAVTSANGIKIAANGGTLSITATGHANASRNAVKAISGTGTNALVYQDGNEQ